MILIWMVDQCEYCRMRFAPFNGKFAGLPSCFKRAGLDPNENHWNCVFDFNKDDSSIPTPVSDTISVCCCLIHM